MPSLETLPAPDLAGPPEDKWRREQRAFRQLLPELLRTHPGQFVAIHEGRVVEAGPDKVDIACRAYERFGYLPIFVTQVLPSRPDPVRIPSPRRLDGPAA